MLASKPKFMGEIFKANLLKYEQRRKSEENVIA
jgi:hypothetical protein